MADELKMIQECPDCGLTRAEALASEDGLCNWWRSQTATPDADWHPPTKSERLARAQQDAYQAAQALADGDYLRADILLKLAIDEIADTGLLP